MTNNDNEEGKVVAKVIKTKSGDIATIYIDNSVFHIPLIDRFLFDKFPCE